MKGKIVLILTGVVSLHLVLLGGICLSGCYKSGGGEKATKTPAAIPAPVPVSGKTVQAEQDRASERVSYSACPMFNWPRKGSGKYLLEWSESPDFPSDKISTQETERTFYAPGILQSGTWNWRVKDRLSGKVIAKGIITVPKRSYSYLPPDYNFQKIAESQHPRLLALSKLALKTDPNLKTKALKCLANGIPPDPLPWSPGQKDMPQWIDWCRKVSNGVVTATGTGMRDIGQAAEAFGDDELTEKAKILLLDISKNWSTNNGSSLKYGDLQAGFLLEGMCWCYDAAYGRMTPEERTIALSAITTRAKQFWGAINPFGHQEAQNHPWSMATTLSFAATITAGENSDSQEWFDYTFQLYTLRFLPALGFEGENNEGLSYWSYGGNIIAKYADLIKCVYGIDLYQHPWLAQTARFPIYCAPPQGFTVSFSDAAQNGLSNHGNMGPVDRVFSRKLASSAKDPYALCYSGTADDGEIIAKVPTDIPQSRFFSHIGLAVFNTCLTDARENVSLGFHSGKYFAGHQHADQNSFVINAYGDKLAIDGGYYDWYGSPHFKTYSIQTQAHNTVLVNGKGQAVHKSGADGMIKNYFDSWSFGYAEGDAANPLVYGGELSEFNRKIIFVKPEFVIIYDKLSSRSAPAVFTWMLHAHGSNPIKIDSASKTFEVIRPSAYLYGKAFCPEDINMSVENSYDVQPLIPFSSQPLRSESIDQEKTMKVSNVSPVGSTVFLTGLQILKPENFKSGNANFANISNDGCDGIEVKSKSGSSMILFRKKSEGNIIIPGKFETDAEVAAVKFDMSGNMVDAMLARGTFLSLNGNIVHKSASPENWAMREFPKPLVKASGDFLKIDGVNIPAEITESKQPEGGSIYVVSASFSVSNNGKYTISAAGLEAGAKLHYRISSPAINSAGTVSGDKRSVPMFLAPSKYLLTLTTRSLPCGVELSSVKSRVCVAEILPASYSLPKNAIKIEAESPCSESETHAFATDKVGASGGKASCEWGRATGQWADWEFTLSESADYTLLIRAAGTYNGVLREILIDGRQLSPDYRIVRWDSTGGWCRDSDDWRYFKIPIKIPLEKGKHVIRITYLNEPSNLDLLAFAPEQ